MNVAIFDSGAGNVLSLQRAFEAEGATVEVEPNAYLLLTADALVLPGGGVFAAAAKQLERARTILRSALDDGFPALGIGVGMQLLFDRSADQEGTGIGVIPGEVRRLRTRRVPHLGWNTVEAMPDDPLFTAIAAFSAYFANSCIGVPVDGGDEVAWTLHEHVRFAAAVRRANVWGVQFHPEKSGAAGLRLLRNFLAHAAAARATRRRRR